MNHSTKFKPALTTLVLAAFLTIPLNAADSDITIEKPWIRLAPPAAKVTAAYLTIHNHTDQNITLSSASSPIAREVKPMITTSKTIDGKEVKGMAFVKSFTIPAKGKRVLKPGGDHLMVMGLTQPVPKNETTTITITFEPGGIKKTINFSPKSGS